MAHDPRAGKVAIRYLRILQGIQQMQNVGFGRMLDTATEEQMDDHEETVDFLESELTRVGVLRVGG